MNLDKDGFFFAMGVRNYLSNEYKDAMATTRGQKVDKANTDTKGKIQDANKPYSYMGFTDPTGPNPWVKWEARVFEGDGLTSKILQTVGMHQCTEKEWAVAFYNPASKDAKKLNDLRKN